jgi:hypothetical protein
MAAPVNPKFGYLQFVGEPPKKPVFSVFQMSFGASRKKSQWQSPKRFAAADCQVAQGTRVAFGGR